MSEQIRTIKIEDELKNSYIDYAMSVIVGRALPDVRDGLKPVQRRVLYAMHELNNDWNKPYKKSARVVGDVIGKYHPHGDTACYDAVVRMAQSFSLRYPLIDGQGNFGSIDGDSAAAMRYTEIRMSKITHQIMSDIEKETVDFQPNYDNSEQAPSVMPTRIPNLLVNGTAGIAVGMATNIPPHHLGSVMNACIAMVDQPDISIDALISIVQGPDFPTGATICGRQGIDDAYRTGRGKIYIRAKAEIVGDVKPSIIVTEIPYMVNKARLLEKIALLVREKKIEGITALRDESDRDGMRIVIECARHENADVILNKLYVHTQMQNVFGINMVALEGNQPRCMNLRDIIASFITHRQDVVRRRTRFELQKAREKGHVLEGLSVALANLDEIIQLIKTAKNPAEAKEQLINKSWSIRDFALPIEDVRLCQLATEPEAGLKSENMYQLSSKQAQSILDLRLHRLTGMERDKILKDYQAIIDLIRELVHILTNFDALMAIVKDELKEVVKEHDDERRTEISDYSIDVDELDLIPDEMMVVTLSNMGYLKSQLLSDYQAQHRGGKGKIAASNREDDFMKYMCLSSSHDVLLCFSSYGKVYWLNVCKIQRSASRTARGKPINNMIELADGEFISAMLPISRQEELNHYYVMVTQKGVIKKIRQDAFSRQRSSGIRALSIDEGDCLIAVKEVKDGDDILLFADSGKAIRFGANSIRSVGRTARGVRGMRIADNNNIKSVIITKDNDGSILTVSERGYGKQTLLSEFRVIGRGGQGVIAIQCSDRNGPLSDAVYVSGDEELVILTDGGSIVRVRVDEISKSGRNTQGVKIIDVHADDKLTSIQLIDEVVSVADDGQ